MCLWLFTLWSDCGADAGGGIGVARFFAVMGVDVEGHFRGGMSHAVLDLFYIKARLKEAGAVAMPEDMRGEVCVDGCLFCMLPHFPIRGLRQRLTVSTVEHKEGIADGSLCAEGFQCVIRERDVRRTQSVFRLP